MIIYISQNTWIPKFSHGLPNLAITYKRVIGLPAKKYTGTGTASLIKEFKVFMLHLTFCRGSAN